MCRSVNTKSKIVGRGLFVAAAFGVLLGVRGDNEIIHAAVVSGEIESKSESAVTVRGNAYEITKDAENRGKTSIRDAKTGMRITISTKPSGKVAWYRLIESGSALTDAMKVADEKSELLETARQARIDHMPQAGRFGMNVMKFAAANNDGDYVSKLVRFMVTATSADMAAAVGNFELVGMVIHKDVTWMTTNHLKQARSYLQSMPAGLRLPGNTAAGLISKINAELERRSAPLPAFDVEVGPEDQLEKVVFDLSSADQDPRLLESDSARVVQEPNGVVYWAPRVPGKTATVIYKIDLPGELVAIKRWGISATAYNHYSPAQFDENSQADLQVSRDGENWVTVQSNFGFQRPENNFQAKYDELGSTRTLYVKARLRFGERGKSVVYAQFLRGNPKKGEFPALDVVCRGSRMAG